MGNDVSAPPQTPLWRSAWTPQHFEPRTLCTAGIPGRIVCIDVDHCRKLIAVGTTSGAVLLRLEEEGNIARDVVVIENDVSVNAVLFVQGSNKLVVVVNNSIVQMWEVFGKLPFDKIFELNLEKKNLQPTCWRMMRNYDYQFLLFGTQNGMIQVIDTNQGHISSVGIIDEGNDEITDLEVSPKDANIVLTGHSNGTVAVWDLETGEKKLERSGVKSLQIPVCAVAWREDSSAFASCGRDGFVIVHSFNKKKNIPELPLAVIDLTNVVEMGPCIAISLCWLLPFSTESEFGNLFAYALVPEVQSETKEVDHSLLSSGRGIWINGNDFSVVRFQELPGSTDFSNCFSFVYKQSSGGTCDDPKLPPPSLIYGIDNHIVENQLGSNCQFISYRKISVASAKYSLLKSYSNAKDMILELKRSQNDSDEMEGKSATNYELLLAW